MLRGQWQVASVIICWPPTAPPTPCCIELQRCKQTHKQAWSYCHHHTHRQLTTTTSSSSGCGRISMACRKVHLRQRRQLFPAVVMRSATQHKDEDLLVAGLGGALSTWPFQSTMIIKSRWQAARSHANHWVVDEFQAQDTDYCLSHRYSKPVY